VPFRSIEIDLRLRLPFFLGPGVPPATVDKTNREIAGRHGHDCGRDGAVPKETPAVPEERPAVEIGTQPQIGRSALRASFFFNPT